MEILKTYSQTSSYAFSNSSTAFDPSLPPRANLGKKSSYILYVRNAVYMMFLGPNFKAAMVSSVHSAGSMSRETDNNKLIEGYKVWSKKLGIRS